MDVQAELGLHCPDMPEDTFSCGAPYFTFRGACSILFYPFLRTVQSILFRVKCAGIILHLHEN